MKNQHGDKLEIIEVFETSNPPEIHYTGTWASANYPLMKAGNPRPSSDFSGFAGYPTLPLIDASTMEVIVKDCWNTGVTTCVNTNMP